MLNRAAFFNRLKTFNLYLKLNNGNVESFEAIINEWESKCYNDIRWLAYIMATVYHETAKTMQPIEEYGKGKGRAYGLKIKMDRTQYTEPDKLYYGRGLVQLTWYENYQKMGKLLGVDLLNQPELALSLPVSVKILFEGMTKGKSSFGDFTGKSLENYFNSVIEDPINARRIINGKDKASLIAGYYESFKKCLQ